VLAEGMVRLSSMSDDYYTFFPERQELLGQRTGRTLRMGQKVSVILEEVSLARLEITLSIVPAEQAGGASRKKRRGRG